LLPPEAEAAAGVLVVHGLLGDAARARGRHGGRPSVLTGHKAQVVQEMYASGQYSVAAIATTLGVSRASIYRHLDRAGG
jgi:DNA invertase Pin-like site-specific DNA recombinase